MANSGKAAFFPTLKNKSPWDYFQNRIRSVAELKRLLPLQPIEQKEFKSELNNPAPNKKRCIYIHIPFCTKSCSFCGYYKCIQPEKQTVENYVSALKKQMKYLSEKQWVKSAPFTAVYFGGGTPTSLPVHFFQDLLNTVFEKFRLTENCEVTLESTISELGEDYLELISQSGVNRISLGVQSFHEKIRGNYSRQSNYNDITAKIAGIRESGIKNCCVDLMYNLEGQTTKTWKHDLEIIKETGITGCSLYPLLPFPNAPLVKSGNFPKPSPETEFNCFKMADDFFMALKDWEVITTVQYGHKKHGNARYVEMQAEGADLLALGPGAGGKINGLHYINSFTINDFLNDNSFPSEKTRIFCWQTGKESLAQKLKFFRKTFLLEKEFLQTFKNKIDTIDFLYENTLIEKKERTVQLTQTGKYWAANLMKLIIES